MISESSADDDDDHIDMRPSIIEEDDQDLSKHDMIELKDRSMKGLFKDDLLDFIDFEEP